jgi:hypothetical protein
MPASRLNYSGWTDIVGVTTSADQRLAVEMLLGMAGASEAERLSGDNMKTANEHLRLRRQTQAERRAAILMGASPQGVRISAWSPSPRSARILSAREITRPISGVARVDAINRRHRAAHHA